jgi:tetratricopeptide (TPR) repeat protein
VVTNGTSADARRVIDTAAKADQLKPMFAALLRGPAEPVSPSTDPRAEAAYLFGNICTSLNRPDAAADMYRLALEYQPSHAWSCNNLGYYLAEQGTSMDEAERLLEAAYAALPGEASIIDSLGWLRYKRGLLTDEQDAATGAVSRRGAVSLLSEATAKEKGAENPTLLDHLGDAQWVQGSKDAALRSWRTAEEKAVLRVNAMTRAGASPAALGEIQTLLQQIRAKRAAASRSEEPSVAPRAH